MHYDFIKQEERNRKRRESRRLRKGKLVNPTPEPINLNSLSEEDIKSLLLPRIKSLVTPIKRVYVVQYDYMWSLTPQQWAECIVNVMIGDGYDLTHYKELKSKPKDVRKDERDYYSTRNDILVVSPLDWQNDEWLYSAKEINLIQENEFIWPESYQY